ncbi:MAG: hypothetical protein ACRC6K_04325 [Fusobacteriaceae bacterium]
MKNKILLSLLALSLTSYSAIVGTIDDVELPIKIKGEVVAKNSELTITPIKSAGVSGASMEFDFGQMGGTNSQKLEGTFAIKRADASTISGSNIEIGMLDETGGTIKRSVRTVTAPGPGGGVIIDYAVFSSKSSDNVSYQGTLEVKIRVPASAEPGSFLDTTKKIAIKMGS